MHIGVRPKPQMQSHRKTRFKQLVAVGIISAILGLVAFVVTRHPIRSFESAVSSVASAPDRWIDSQVSLSTYGPEQPIIGSNVTSRDINREVIEAYQQLASHFKPAPVTYFSESGDMPTQETIWQYPSFFVRLYVTSSLDSDGAAVGAFPGAYEKFRKGRLSESADLYSRFTPIPFQAPARFLANR